MELLLINYLEESKTRYVDVEIIDYSIDGANCEVKFTHTEQIEFEIIEQNCSINMWNVMAYLNLCNNK